MEEIQKERFERLKERDKFAQLLSDEDYKYFSQCCHISFIRPNRNKFFDWLINGCNLIKYNLILSKEIVDIIGHILYYKIERIVRKAKELKGTSQYFNT